MNSNECSVFGLCGACDPVSRNYDDHFAKKAQHAKVKLFDLFNIEAELVSAPKPMHTRQRLLLRIHTNSNGICFGFFKKKSRTIVPIRRCELTTPLINQFLDFISSLEFSTEHEERFRLHIDEVYRDSKTEEKALCIMIVPAQKDSSYLDLLSEKLRLFPKLLWLGLACETERAPLFCYDRQFATNFYFSPGLFRQAHQESNHKLRELIRTECEVLGVRTLLDLFSGSGNLSLGIEHFLEEMTLVEQVPQASRCIERTQSELRNQNAKIKVISQTAEVFLQRNLDSFDMLICDPPRSSMIVQHPMFNQLRTNYMFFVSCSLANLREQANSLNQYYAPVKLWCLDHFPFNTQVETLILFRRFASESGPYNGK